jgi:hypothetical protein
MFLDEKRKGKVERQKPAACMNWELGPKGSGAVIMPKTKRYEDAENVTERAPLELAWYGKGDLPQNWEATLIVNYQDRIKIFDGRNAGANCVLGDKQDSFDLHKDPHMKQKLSKPDARATLWMEAEFPDKESDMYWLVGLLLLFKPTKESQPIQQQAELRIAPWIMSSDLDRTDKIFIQKVDELPSIKEFGQSAGVTVVEGEKGIKVFSRDAIKSGFCSAPHYHLVACMNKLEEKSPIKLSIPRDIGVIEKYKPQESQDNGGNYLVTPILDGYPYGRIIFGEGDDPKKCTWGNFLKAQRIQKPIVINTGWLDVGHADEILSFVPDRNKLKTYKVLIASTRLAYLLLYGAEKLRRENGGQRDLYDVIDQAEELNNELKRNTEGLNKWKEKAEAAFGALDEAPLPANEYIKTAYNPNGDDPHGLNGRVVFSYKPMDIDIPKGFFGIPPDKAPAQDDGPHCLVRVNTRDMIKKVFTEGFGDYQYKNQGILDQIEKKLQPELGENFGFLPIPLILNAGAGGAVPFTGDSVNMLILNVPGGACRCLVPKPFGPIIAGEYVFEKYIQLQLERLQVNVTFLNDPNFHYDDGEIHCGTNQIPVNASYDWWNLIPRKDGSGFDKPAPD